MDLFLKCFRKKYKRKDDFIPNNDDFIPNNDPIEVHWSRLHLTIVHNYFQDISDTCNFRELPDADLFDQIIGFKSGGSPLLIRPQTAASFPHDIRYVFMVPRLNKFHESQNCIKKYQPLEAFISCLLQLLYDKTESIIDPWKDQIVNLEKELRFLLIILGDISLMLCEDEHEHEEFLQGLFPEFEAVANEAGSILHSLIFSIDLPFGNMSEGLAVILSHMDLLKSKITKFLDLLSSNSRLAYTTPKTSVMDSPLIVDSLITDLEDLMNQDDNRPIADVKDQIQTLHQGLTFLQSFIKNIISPQPSEIGELKELLMRIGGMSHQAEYLIILAGDVPLWYLINRLTDINNKIALIGIKLQEVTTKYQFGGLEVAKYSSAQLSLQSEKNPEVNDVIVGFEDKVTYMLHHLVGGTEHLQVISIYGMPGLGKTTLGKMLYNHPSVKQQFDRLSWCVISQTYQNQSILTSILIDINHELDKDSIMKMGEAALVEHIHKTLKGRRYLIVMDDVWDSNVWDDMRTCFPDDGNGSRILFTTRIKDVAPPNSIIYALPSLSNDQCWELLHRKVFNDKTCPPELLGIGRKIAANGCGLPLAIVVIAGILSAVDKKKSTWEKVGRNLASYIFEGGDNSVVKQILELSYRHLPEHLKPCFLYFGAFLKEKQMQVGKLMRLWIAEGFIHKVEGKSVEDVAEGYLKELIDKSLVMVAKRRSDGGVKACVIHDLLRDLCFKRCEEENFLKFVNNCNSIYKKGHRLQGLYESHQRVSWYCQHVRSFCCRGTSVPLYVRDRRLLRVLHFDDIYTHFIGIEYLAYLRYLVIEDLPTSIGSLVNLEYLCVRSPPKVVYLSSAIMKMKKLRYIQVGGHYATYDKDCNSSQRNNLEFLSGIIVRDLRDEDMLKCSPNLCKLKCKSPRLLGEGKEFRQLDLSFLTRLESLNVEFDVYYMKGISYPSSIRKLTLADAVLTRKKLSIIGTLENLEVLKLRKCIFAGVGEDWDTKDGEFQRLTFLKLDDMLHLTEWNVASSEHFPSLQRLVLRDCSALREIPCEIGEIVTLQWIEVNGHSRKSLVESAKRIQQEQLDMGNEELKIIIRTAKPQKGFSRKKKE